MTYNNILIIKIRAMGDTLLVTPSITALRQAYPNAKITALVSPIGYDILENNPNLDHIQVFNKSMKLLVSLVFPSRICKSLNRIRWNNKEFAEVTEKVQVLSNNQL